MTPRMLLDRYWDLLKNIIFHHFDENFLTHVGVSIYWIAKLLTIQFDFPWNQQMRNILEYRFRTGTSCFELSDFEKYSKYHPKLNQKLVSSARRAKPELARHAPASIITLRDRALRVNLLSQQSRWGLTTMIPETPRTHRDIQIWYFKKSKFHQNFSPHERL